MMSNAKRVLVLMAMTTALCADQVVVAAPSSPRQGVEVADLAQRLVARLSQNLKSTVPAAVCQPRRQSRPAAPLQVESVWQTPSSVAHQPASPFQFRLPPPIV
jgi:hypothetical protein